MANVMRFTLFAFVTALTLTAAPFEADASAGRRTRDRTTLRSFATEDDLSVFLARVTAAQKREQEKQARAEARQRERTARRLRALQEQRARLERRRAALGEARYRAELARIENQEFRLHASSLSEAVQVSSSTATGADTVTTVQHEGVDEGALVKRHGDHLVILRRGRLFTIRIGRGDLTPVAVVPAYDPRIRPQRQYGSWYDELLVSGDNVIVIGYSYDRGGTEIGLFSIGDAGDLAHRATYHLRSGDYYSAENYASRLIGTRLIVYAPATFDGLNGRGFPELRRWTPTAADSDFTPFTAPTRVYGPVRPYGRDDASLELHNVVICDLARPDLVCEATTVMGGPRAEFYVSPSAVYVWAFEDWARDDGARAMVYRIPIDGSAPSALGVRGTPFDQFSFLETEGTLSVVLEQPEASASTSASSLALLRVPLSLFGDGRSRAPRTAYAPLMTCPERAVRNRFVGRRVIVACGTWKEDADQLRSTVTVTDLQSGSTKAASVPLFVWRIDRLGEHAVLAGPTSSGAAALGVLTLRLDEHPSVVGVLPPLSAGIADSRSQAFGFAADNATDGVLALPVTLGGSQPRAAMVMVRSRDLFLSHAGTVYSSTAPAADGCVVSCLDWYGDARPIFIDGRVLALLGYELVEVESDGERVSELRRASFAPEQP